MDVFEWREKGFEAKYRFDQELSFRMTARRDRLFGQWAADRMGLPAAETEAYIKSLIAVDLRHGEKDGILRKVHADLRARGVEIDERDLRRELERSGMRAKEQVTGEYPASLDAMYKEPGSGV